MRWLLFLLFLKITLGQLVEKSPSKTSKRDVTAMMNMPQITNIDVDCGRSGMTVNVQFSQPFDGIIYSKGHYSDPSCRYVAPGGSQTSYLFKIRHLECGTQTVDISATKSSVMNTIIIQMDPDVQEIWDTAKKLTCSWTSRHPKKEIKFEPFEVSMLQVMSMNYMGDEINCWMDIQKGVYPMTSPITGNVEIGDEISMMIFLQDTEDKMDVGVRDCWAFSGDTVEDPSASRVQLTSSTGCILRPKLMGRWKKTRTLINSRDTLVAHATVSAFKFPDLKQIHLMCNAEVCYGQCQQCNEEEKAALSHNKSSNDEVVAIDDLEVVQEFPPQSINVEEKSETGNHVPDNFFPILEVNQEFPVIGVQEVQEEEESFSTTDEDTPQENIIETSRPTVEQNDDNVPPDQSDGCNGLENCKSLVILESEDDETQNITPDHKSSVVSILNCLSGNNNVFCQNLNVNDSPDVVIDKCTPGSSDPRCSWTIQHFREIDCTKHSDHPQCLTQQNISPTQDSEDYILDCIEDSSNPKCLISSQEVNCETNPDSQNCQSLKEIPANEATQESLCSIDSTDPSCLNDISQSEIPSCGIDSDNPSCISDNSGNETPQQCDINSNDPNCLNDVTQTDIPSPPQCNSESNDPNCISEPISTVDEQDICILQPDHPLCSIRTEDSPLPNETGNECIEGSENPSCIDKSTINCDPTSPESACNVVPNTNGEETEVFDCSTNVDHPRCLNAFDEVDCISQPDNPQCSDSISTKESRTKDIECNEDSTDISCLNQSTIDLQCDPNSNNPQCQNQPPNQPIETSESDCSLFPDNPLCKTKGDTPPEEQGGEQILCDEKSLDTRCHHDNPNQKLNIECDPLSPDSKCPGQPQLEDLCFPGSKDVRCRSNTIPSSSETQEKSPDKMPKPKQVIMDKKDDFHGDKDPRYHAFHSWLYQQAPRPRKRAKRSFILPSEVLRNHKFNRVYDLQNKTRSRLVKNDSDSGIQLNNQKYKSREFILNVNTVFEELRGNERESYGIIKEKIKFSESKKTRKELLIFTLSFCCIFSFFLLINFYLCKVQLENRTFNV